MLDKTLPYYNIIMKRQEGTKTPNPILPKGFSFNLYTEGDEIYWAKIETLVGEFDSIEEALDYFGKVIVFEGMKRMIGLEGDRDFFCILRLGVIKQLIFIR